MKRQVEELEELYNSELETVPPTKDYEKLDLVEDLRKQMRKSKS